LVDFYYADGKSVSDYYPFGMGMDARSQSAGGYRWGFNGMEKYDDWQGEGNAYDFGARVYDSRLGRWMSVDPLAHLRESLSPYNYCSNNPIMRTDPTGALDGDYYDADGNWIANDGIDDGKVYHADQNGNVSFGVGVLNETQFTEWNYTISDPKLQEYFPTLLSHEGGFANHPNDPGGATNKGITLNTFKKYSMELLNVQPTLDNLKRLTDSQAAAIYETGYWNPSGAGNISDKQLGWLHFDTYLHGGASNVLGNTISSYGESGRSISTLNSILKVNSAENVFNTYKQERLNRFDRIIENNPKLETFRNGWTNRVKRFQYQTP